MDQRQTGIGPGDSPQSRRPGTASSPILTGMFRDRNDAERAYQTLTSRGYGDEDINVIMSDETRKRHFGPGTGDSDLGTKAAEGAGIGGAIGGTVGAIAASIAAVGTSIAIPGLGLVVAGPIAAALAGAGAGGAAGSLLGALVGWGIPEDRVQEYERGIKEGGILMGVRPRSDQDAAHLRREWESHRGEQIHG